jgi:LysM repeat protein
MRPVSRQSWIAFLVVLSLLLAACERPFQSNVDVPEGTGEVTGDTPTDEGTPTEQPTEQPAETTDEGGAATTDESGTATTDEGDATTTDETSGEDDKAESNEGQETTETTEGETTTEETTAPANPSSHIVVAGDTLYKIGLQYSVSWVTLAEFNNLSNPNRLIVGQEIKIPGANPTTEPTPSPQTEEIYTVKAGDNLFRIGLSYSVSWVQIAEANGIVNPNHLLVGQQIKIPMETEGPLPQFSHQVRAGQTLFSISLQYGVNWTAVAEANDIESPYVIFPGQVLVIPGG